MSVTSGCHFPGLMFKETVLVRYAICGAWFMVSVRLPSFPCNTECFLAPTVVLCAIQKKKNPNFGCTWSFLCRMFSCSEGVYVLGEMSCGELERWGWSSLSRSTRPQGPPPPRLLGSPSSLGTELGIRLPSGPRALCDGPSYSQRRD